MIRVLKRFIYLFLSVVTLIIGCKESRNKKPVKQNVHEKLLKKTPLIGGNYVSEGYRQRAEGYDWVAVSVKKLDSEKISIKVRSRADKKKPTCTFDATAYKQDDTIYTTVVNGKTVIFDIHQDSLSIRTEEAGEDGILYFYCSGGATLAGNYRKIKGVIDATQVDKTDFSKVLSLQGIGFNVSTIKKEGQHVLTVSPFGLEIDNSPQTYISKGQVVKAMVEDMNSDGSPELLVISKSEDTSKKGRVYGFSVNNRKSMSPVHFLPTDENQRINQGYQGHDEFALVETKLLQRFPIFDAAGQPSGKTRQVSYELKDGEALRKFEIVTINEY
ncbi:hypothetical protein [Pareuzebyella sediminis]|uniref:hypothetical protein n=1 Tax=Pareuzebyella sediminis TaxID=2607998 RepID=UPI0011F09079|nr:hypothetical protein [Pareuzebyella sediminis]